MMRLRVAVVVDSDTFGGAEAYARNLLRWLPAWCHRALVVSEPVAGHFAGTADDVTVVPLSRYRESAPAVAEALSRVTPDVVQVNLADPASNLAGLDAAVSVAPTVATLHLHGTPPDRPFPLVSSAIAPSAPIAAQLAALGVPPPRVVRMRHGVELPAQVTRHHPGDASVTIGAVAQLIRQKGLDLLLESVRRLTAEGLPLRALIAGEGEDEMALREQADGLPVHFAGFCRDVPAFLRRLDVFCLPSRHEGLSLALLEAAAHGLPCVTTAVGDTTEALGGAALIVEPENATALTAALRHLVDVPPLRRDMGVRARARATREFDVRMMASRTSAVLSQAARRPVRVPG
jgi:glycosyltransferase involved in cell wall biosynthesis